MTTRRRWRSPLAAGVDALRVNPTSGDSIHWLDGVRALAVIAIFVRHSWGLAGQPNLELRAAGHSVHLGPVIVMLYVGVDLFYVLSGYLLSQRFLSAAAEDRPPPAYRSYLRRRLFRICPAYYAAFATVILLCTPVFIEPNLVWSADGLRRVVVHGLFLQTVDPLTFGSFSIMSPYWTLSIEMAFYLVLPFMVRAFVRGRWRWGMPLFLGVSLGWVAMSRYSMAPAVHAVQWLSGSRDWGVEVSRFFLSHTLPGALSDFAVGITVAAFLGEIRAGSWSTSKWKRGLSSPSAGVGYLAAGIGLGVAMVALNGPHVLYERLYQGDLLFARSDGAALRFMFLEQVPFGVAFGLVIVGLALAPRQVRAPLNWSFLGLIGTLGYSIYLLHMPLLYVMGRLPSVQADTATAVWFRFMGIAGTGILVLSLFWYLGFERPFMLAGRKHPASAPPPTDTPDPDKT